jgi:gamma-glutamyl-gamma-aminobutyrate hydrolase PuuD
MKILIVPTIRKIYKDQIEYCVDFRLLKFIKKIFNNASIEIYNLSIVKKYNLIIFAGGNSSYIKTDEDKVRNSINNKIYSFAIKNKIKMLGICHGSHFLAKKNKFKIRRKKNHVGNHYVNFYINKKKLLKIVNSYHNEVIEYKRKKNINLFCIADDNTVEGFHIKNKKILGIMWHPERYKFYKNFDKRLIKEFNATNSIISR